MTTRDLKPMVMTGDPPWPKKHLYVIYVCIYMITMDNPQIGDLETPEFGNQNHDSWDHPPWLARGHISICLSSSLSQMQALAGQRTKGMPYKDPNTDTRCELCCLPWIPSEESDRKVQWAEERNIINIINILYHHKITKVYKSDLSLPYHEHIISYY